MKHLIESIEAFNVDKMPVFVSVPSGDRQLFLDKIGSRRCEWISDEEIVAANPAISWNRIKEINPALAQQVIKSEFWRLQDSVAYLCMDSDSKFIRPFQSADFLAADGAPYTTLHQSKELLQLSLNMGQKKLVENFRKDSALGKALFNRRGPDYDFGPTPVIWSAKVWKDLATNYLEPHKMSFLDAIVQFPAELRWYGEALLEYESIPLRPIEPLFKVYHTDWQYFSMDKMGETTEKLKENYLGVVMQSNWHYEMDLMHSGSTVFSGVARKIKRQMKRIF